MFIERKCYGIVIDKNDQILIAFYGHNSKYYQAIYFDYKNPTPIKFLDILSMQLEYNYLARMYFII